MHPLVNITFIVGSWPSCVSGKSAHSSINSLDIARFWAKVRQAPNGCWEWTASRTGGRDRKLYGQFSYTVDGAQVNGYAHRFAWMIAHGPIPPGRLICHHCDNGICVRDDHLFLGTQSDNMRDASRKGRLNAPRIATRERIAELQQRWLAGGITQAELAVIFGASPAQISRWMKAVKQRPYERRPAVMDAMSQRPKARRTRAA